METKYFKDIKCNDTIYYYIRKDWDGPSPIKKFEIIHTPIFQEWNPNKPIVEVDFHFEGGNLGNWYETIWIGTDDSQDTVVLENGYGEITIKVFTTFEEAVTHRKNYINGLIESHENAITKLKELI